MSTSTFERVELQDVDSLVNFAVESHDIYNTRKASLATVKELFAISETSVIDETIEVLMVDNSIVGFYCLQFQTDSEIELTHLFVKKGLQRHGYGRKLFNRCLEKARSFESYTVLSWISDPDSIEFYLSLGGECVGVDDNLLNPDVPVAIFNYQLR